MTHGGNVWQSGSPEDWLDFSANIRPEGAPEWVKQALWSAVGNVSYYPDPEMRRARAAIAKYLSVSEACVRPTAGGISAIDMATHLNASDMVICTPCFAEYGQLAANRGRTVKRASLLSGRHCIGDPVEEIGGALTEGCAVWLCNPLNPTGTAFACERVEALLDRVEALDGWLIVDEAFIDYCPEHSVVSMVERRERLLVTGSMTKILGIPGVRLGYLCAQPRILAQLERYQLTWELSCFAEAVACALPEHTEEIRQTCRLNAARREALRQELEALGAFVYPSEAAFLLADFGRPVAAVERALSAQGILVRSCMSFDGLDDGRHLRLAVKDEAANERLIRALREALTCAENL